MRTGRPVLRDLPAPEVLAYPMETVIAEKVEAMVSLGMLNSRMKDFFDMAVAARRMTFDGEMLVRAFRATFARRGTPLPDGEIPALSSAFTHDSAARAHWEALVDAADSSTSWTSSMSSANCVSSCCSRYSALVSQLSWLLPSDGLPASAGLKADGRWRLKPMATRLWQGEDSRSSRRRPPKGCAPLSRTSAPRAPHRAYTARPRQR